MLVIFFLISFLKMSEATMCVNNQQCLLCMDNGQCLSECNNGYYGLRCNLTCSTGCRNNTCHLITNGIGKCSNGCTPGFYGSQCNIPCKAYENTCRKCPQECEGGFCQLGSSCARKCQDSYYGTACKSCPTWCEVCNRVSGTCDVCLHCEGDCSQGCKEGCEVGYFGKFCEQRCNTRCLSGCNEINGDCFKCKTGWNGGTCEKQCPDKCIGGACGIKGCKEGCEVGYFGTFCEHTCSSKCASGCEQMSGKCFSCKSGWYGQMCESKCGSGCARELCNVNGTCIDGCRAGFYGDQCQYQCQPSCLNKLCDDEDGTCKSCKRDFYGSHCEKSCVRCLDGSCKQDSGHCVKGCLSNFRGDFCQHDCEGNCTTEECLDVCKTEYKARTAKYLIAGFIFFFIIFLVVVVYVTYHFKRIQNNLNKLNWEASARTRDAEQEDARSFNTVPSINLESEQDMSQVGVQVVVLKHDGTSSGSLVSMEDEIVDKRVPGREHLRQGIVDVPSGSDTIKKLGGAQKKGGSIEICNADCDLKNDTKIIVEDDSECDDVIAYRNMKEDEEGIVSSRDAMFIGGKDKMEMILEDVTEFDDNVDDRKMVIVTIEEKGSYCEIRSNGWRGEINPNGENDLEECLSDSPRQNGQGEMFVTDPFNNENNFSDTKQEIITGFSENYFIDQQDRVQSIKDTQHDCDDREGLTSTDIMIGSDDAEEDNDDHDLDITDNQSIEDDENETTMEAAKGRQPESARAVNTELQLALDVPDNLSLTYDENGITMEAAKGRQPESARALDTVPQLTDAQVEKEKHYVEVFLMSNN